MATPVTISTASVPASYCANSIQVAWPFLVSLLTAELAGLNNTFNDGDTTPAPDDQNRPWLPTSFSGVNPPAFVYKFVDGVWIMPNPNPTGLVAMYQGSEASIDTFDGGEAGTVTATTGPMWQKVSAIDGRFPIGPGTVGTTSIGIGATGGTGEHTLALDEIPAHTHPFTGRDYIGSGNLSPAKVIIDDDYGGTENTVATSAGGQGDGSTKAVNTMPPYLGIWFIVRTARKYYRR